MLLKIFRWVRCLKWNMSVRHDMHNWILPKRSYDDLYYNTLKNIIGWIKYRMDRLLRFSWFFSGHFRIIIFMLHNNLNKYLYLKRYYLVVLNCPPHNNLGDIAINFWILNYVFFLKHSSTESLRKKMVI